MNWLSFLEEWNHEMVARWTQHVRKHGIGDESAPLDPNNQADYWRNKLVSLGVKVAPDYFDPPSANHTDEEFRQWFVERKQFQFAHDPPFDDSVINSITATLCNGGLMYPPATPDQLSAAENRLGVSLPQSYRDFVSVSNGFITYLEILLPVEQIGFVRDKLPDLAALSRKAKPVSDSDYFVYGDDQPGDVIRYEYFPDCLAISKPYGGNLDRWTLLNPHIRMPDGEWEVITYIRRVGVCRYRSISEMMRQLRQLETPEAFQRRAARAAALGPPKTN